MELESQVCTPEQGERLKQLGVFQKSLFYWTHSEKWGIMYWTSIDFRGNPTSVFTAAELGVFIPDYTQKLGNLEIGKCETDHVSMKPLKEGWWNVSYWTWATKDHKRGGIYLEQKSAHLHQAPNLAQAMAAMLIYLIEKKLVKVDQINQRLKNA